MSEEPHGPIKPRLRRIWNNAIAEGLNALLFLLLLYGGRKLVELLFGEAKFFDYVPLRYVFDLGDLAVIGRFIWNSLRN